MSYLFTELLSALAQFHFLRPWFLVAVLPGIVLAFLLARQNGHHSSWHGVIALELLPYLLEQNTATKQHHLHWWLLIPWFCACLALAGPSWSKIPLPIHKQQTPLVILFDLSPSMLAEDIKPNRLTRARLKLIDLLQSRQEGTTALVAYAGDAHIVTPLTDDTATIISLLPALKPTMMPQAGNQPEQALEKGIELIFKSGFQNGHVLFVSDGIPGNDLSVMNSLLSGFGGFKVSVLALGTNDGAPIPATKGGFVKDNQGNIVIAQLKEKPLQTFARNNGGIYRKISLDDDDIDDLNNIFNRTDSEQTEQLQRTFDTWHDSGFWLVLPILPLLILAFRRNILAIFIIAPLFLGSDKLYALEWQDLWLRSDQQAQKALVAGDAKTAEALFKNPDWKGSAAYKSGNFTAAQKHFKNSERTADSLYNLANAQAQSGQLEAALENYQAALTLKNDHQDAAFNKDLVEKALKQEQQSKDNKDNKDKQDSEKNDSKDTGSSSDSHQESKKGDKDSSQPGESPENKEQESESNAEQNGENKSHKNANDNDNPEHKNPASPEEKPEEKNESTANDSKPQSTAGAEPSAADKMSEEQRQALEQWLRRVPDDPSGLMRRKFEYEAWQKNQQGQGIKQEKERW